MLIVDYCYGIRSVRRLCEEVHLNLGYRWFCRLGLDGLRGGTSGASVRRDVFEAAPREVITAAKTRVLALVPKLAAAVAGLTDEPAIISRNANGESRDQAISTRHLPMRAAATISNYPRITVDGSGRRMWNSRI